MKRPPTLLTLPVAAAAAVLISAAPVSAAPAAAPAATAPATVTAGFHFTPSPFLNTFLEGSCQGGGLESPIVAMQRINWIWAPLGLDNAKADAPPLPKVLVPNKMEVFVDSAAWRARHDLAPGQPYTASAPGPQPRNPVTCILQGSTSEGPLHATISGSVVPIPKWLDALQPPIQPPQPPKKA